MIKAGFALEKISTGEDVSWWESLPSRIDIPGERIVLFAALPGWRDGDYRIVARDKEFPDPPPVRRMIEKASVLERLTDAQLDQAMSLMTNRQKERWRMPGKPSIYVDDPELVGMINAIGADPDVVLA